MHDYNLLVCLFICVCIAVIIMAVVCEYFICPTVGHLNVDLYFYYYTIIWIFLFSNFRFNLSIETANSSQK